MVVRIKVHLSHSVVYNGWTNYIGQMTAQAGPSDHRDQILPGRLDGPGYMIITGPGLLSRNLVFNNKKLDHY